MPFNITNLGIYRTRNGKKAVIDNFLLEGGAWPYHGIIEGYEVRTSWAPNGARSVNIHEVHENDIVDFWVDAIHMLSGSVGVINAPIIYHAPQPERMMNKVLLLTKNNQQPNQRRN